MADLSQTLNRNGRMQYLLTKPSLTREEATELASYHSANQDPGNVPDSMDINLDTTPTNPKDIHMYKGYGLIPKTSSYGSESIDTPNAPTSASIPTSASTSIEESDTPVAPTTAPPPMPKATEGTSQSSALARQLASNKGNLDEWKDWAKGIEYNKDVPQEKKDSLKEALNRAEQLYNEKSNRNDWLEVAQTLGRAVAQFAGAQAGQASNLKYGQNMSNLNMGPGIDYGARSDRAFKEYQATVHGATSNYDRDRQEQLDKMAAQQVGNRAREDYYRGAVTEGGQAARALAAEEGANARANNMNKSADLREQLQNQRLAHQDTRDQIKQIEREKETAQAGIPLIAEQVSEDMSTKDLNKMKLQHPKELGALDPKDIEEAKQAATTKGTLWGTNLDKDKFKDALATQVEKKYNDRIQTLRQSLDQLVGSRGKQVQPGSAAPPAPPTGNTPSAPTGMVRMQAPNGAVGNIPSDKVEEAKARGFTLIQ